MNIGKFIFVADRGVLKIYSVDNSANTTLRLVETMEPGEVGGRFQDEYADDAGGFPNGGSAGQGNSISERHDVPLEHEARALRKLTAKISEVLQQNPSADWSLTAPEQINSALLEALPESARKSLVVNVKKDLIREAPDQLLTRLQAAKEL